MRTLFSAFSSLLPLFDVLAVSPAISSAFTSTFEESLSLFCSAIVAFSLYCLHPEPDLLMKPEFSLSASFSCSVSSLFFSLFSYHVELLVENLDNIKCCI